MVEMFERFAWEHPSVAGAIAALAMLAMVGFVGGIERGSIALPF